MDLASGFGNVVKADIPRVGLNVVVHVLEATARNPQRCDTLQIGYESQPTCILLKTDLAFSAFAQDSQRAAFRMRAIPSFGGAKNPEIGRSPASTSWISRPSDETGRMNRFRRELDSA